MSEAFQKKKKTYSDKGLNLVTIFLARGGVLGGNFEKNWNKTEKKKG